MAPSLRSILSRFAGLELEIHALALHHVGPLLNLGVDRPDVLAQNPKPDQPEPVATEKSRKPPGGIGSVG